MTAAGAAGRRAGFTLLELVVASTVMLAVLGGLVMLTASIPKQAHTLAIRVDTQNRLRIARHMLTQELQNAGFGWRREGYSSVDTGTFGSAGYTVTGWPTRPVLTNFSTTGMDTGTDTLTVVLPVDYNALAGVDTTATAVSCPGTTGSAVFPTTTNASNAAGWGGVALLFDANVAHLAPIAAAASSSLTLTIGDCGTAAGGGGVAAGANFPRTMSVTRVKYVTYRVAAGRLQRAEVTTSGGTASFVDVVDGIEDLQVRFVVTVIPLSGAASTGEVLCEGNTGATFPSADNSTCGSLALRKTAISGNDAVRLTAVEVGLGARSLPATNDIVTARPALFDHAAGSSDKYVHRQEVWRVALPNAYAF
ncbi:MAG: hypothetical protein HY904_06450 [Deltaproteobacteria bacterium]|nr:hypothetical protein [Deltaproteobacteria bacterium]